MQRFLCVSCGHTVSVLPGTRLTYRPLEVERLQGFFDAQAGVSCGLDPPPGLVEAGCVHRAWNRLLARVSILKESFGQILPSELHTAQQLWKQLRRAVGSTEQMLRFLARSCFVALSPKARADKGQPRILNPQQQKWVLEQAQAHLAVPVKVLYRRWHEQDPQLPALNSLYRFLREHELHTQARRAQLRQPLGDPTKCFEAPFVNDPWMTDFSPGPYLHPTEDGKAVPTFLCVIIDDHSTLEELNAKFSLWLQSIYHPRVHSTTGMSPVERYQRGAHLVKALDPHLDLDQLFYHQLTRTVRRDGTVRLGNQLYEVDLSLRTLAVQWRFDPFKLDRIEVGYRGNAFGFAKALNAHLNSQIPGSDAYEKRA